MTGIAYSGWGAVKALARRDWRAYDRWFGRASRASDDLARRLEIVVRCRACGDPIVVSPGRECCVVCRASGVAA